MSPPSLLQQMEVNYSCIWLCKSVPSMFKEAASANMTCWLCALLYWEHTEKCILPCCSKHRLNVCHITWIYMYQNRMASWILMHVKAVVEIWNTGKTCSCVGSDIQQSEVVIVQNQIGGYLDFQNYCKDTSHPSLWRGWSSVGWQLLTQL